MAALSMVALQSCRQIYSGQCGANGSELTWTLNDDGTLVIEGQGAMEDWGLGETPWYEYRGDIRAVVIKDGVTSIGKRAFYSCFNLSSVVLPESVTSIGVQAFQNCTSLSSITFPEGLTSIGSFAYFNCTSLTTIMIKAPIPPDIDGTNFGGVNGSIPVYVPASSIDAYRNSEWGRTFSNIQPM